MDRDLQTILLRDNPWLARPGELEAWLESHLPADFIDRSVLQTMATRWSRPGRAHLVIGPRQAGKSSVIWAYLQRRSEPVLWLDCEQALVQQWCSSPALFLDGLDQLLDEPVTLFFDEIQHLDEASLFLKGLVDRKVGVPIMVTGSSSYHLRAGTRDSLAGRVTRSRLMPLSLSEAMRGIVGSRIARKRAIEETFDRHIRFGGYPEIWLSETPIDLLTELVNAIILRDASDLHRIQRPDAFRKLLRLAAGQVGSLVNLAEWSSVLGIDRNTVVSYLEILQSDHILVQLSPFTGGKRSEITRQPRCYLVDCGLRNQLVHDYSPLGDRQDRGPLLESWVFSEIWKSREESTTVHFWRSTSGAEVDFVIDADELTAVEVKAESMRRPKITRSARSFIQAYEPPRLLIVNTGLEHVQTIGRTRVIWTLPTAFPELLRKGGEVS